ncbi:unnamed protein product [Rotaria sordida]|uniref:Sulfotransferase domain-containing protein n=1 Tax=Rotaria sordida TaxID=392033 RepID=A0A818SJG4_9BILA|nr:unnamed protein product [Rotaria sordida]CAF1313893.1 unnamed protein product [Rotaria sordida]CAF3666816.1 unnamed protein product [Rotaria sordida]CAF3781907.1 unnamed protein product [Rotaria sordida]
MASIVLPEKEYELQDHHSDSTIWNEFQFRNDDVIISTYPKSGTTWMQQIVFQLLFNGKEDLQVHKMSLWLDFRLNASSSRYGSKEKLLQAIENQTQRRVLKTHLPLGALVFSPKAKYIFVGRDGRDAVWSLYNHHSNYTDEFYDRLNNSPGRVGPPIQRPQPTFVEYFHNWLEKDGAPFVPFFENIRSWWNVRHLPNVLLIHYSQLKSDLPGQIERIAQFLDIAVDRSSAEWNDILEHCSFDYMKINANKFIPDDIFIGGPSSFFRRGTNDSWKHILTKEDCQRYEEKAQSELGAEAARWLAKGA